MFDPTDLLGGLLQGGGGAGMRGRPMGRLEHAMGERGLGGAGGPLGGLLGQLGHTGGGAAAGRGPAYAGAGGGGAGDILGGLAGMAGRGFGGGGGRPVGRDLAMGGLGALASAILASRTGRGGMGGGLGGALGGALGGGGLGGMLGGALGGGRGGGMMGGGGMGGGGNMRGALGAGGLAVLGMLAMRALRNAGQQRQAEATPMAADDHPDMPPEQATSDRTASLVLRAMIEAAKADGRVDATERQKIVTKAQEDGADREAIAYLQDQLARPLDADSLAAEAGRDPVVAAQVYAASLLAIEVDTPQEQAYLRELASRLGLQSAVVTQLHHALGAPAP